MRFNFISGVAKRTYGDWFTVFNGRQRIRAVLAGLLFLAAQLCSDGRVWGQLDFETEPINYNTAPTEDPVGLLREKIERGDLELRYDEQHGFLKSVLERLDVPISSQVLVFSKTSFQLRRISPQRPRAVYFNDDVYVGWVQGGDVVEISSTDPQQGAVFYTLSQDKSPKPKIVRDRGQCIVCHASSRTSGVPGHLMRSVYPSRTGQPFFGSGTFTIDHRSPFERRWGGWYVTGTHGKQRHLGNVTVTDRNRPEKLNVEQGANVKDLGELFNTKPYLSPHSDIVAMLILAHQAKMHNLITRANYETRSTRHYDAVMNKALERPKTHQSDSSKRRIASAVDKLVEYMLFAGEFALTDRITGTSTFAADFTARGPRDSKGRSLRDFDLNTRMMKYPCSFLIYSAPFVRLPAATKNLAYQRLLEVLTGRDQDVRFAHLSAVDRRAILEILTETKSDLPDSWRKAVQATPAKPERTASE